MTSPSIVTSAYISPLQQSICSNWVSNGVYLYSYLRNKLIVIARWCIAARSFVHFMSLSYYILWSSQINKHAFEVFVIAYMASLLLNKYSSFMECIWLQFALLNVSFPYLLAHSRWLLLVSHPPPASPLGCLVVYWDGSMPRWWNPTATWQCTAHYCWKLPTNFNLQLFCINKGDRTWKKRLWVKEVRKKANLNVIGASVINNGLIVIPSHPHYSHYKSWMRN